MLTQKPTEYDDQQFMTVNWWLSKASSFVSRHCTKSDWQARWHWSLLLCRYAAASSLTALLLEKQKSVYYGRNGGAGHLTLSLTPAPENHYRGHLSAVYSYPNQGQISVMIVLRKVAMSGAADLVCCQCHPRDTVNVRVVISHWLSQWGDTLPVLLRLLRRARLDSFDRNRARSAIYAESSNAV